MKITKKWLKDNRACKEGCDWFFSQKETDSIKILKKLVREDRVSWANWTIVRLMNYKQNVEYAVFAAEQVLSIFEEKYPEDDRPRKAIEAAKKCIDNPSKKNKQAAYHAAVYAVYAAAVYAAVAAAASSAAAAAASAAAAAASAAAAADAAASSSSSSSANHPFEIELKTKIINFGISLLEKRRK